MTEKPTRIRFTIELENRDDISVTDRLRETYLEMAGRAQELGTAEGKRWIVKHGTVVWKNNT